jgi:hypothetical protein
MSERSEALCTDPTWANTTLKLAAAVAGQNDGSNGVCNSRLDLSALQGLTPYTKVRIAARAFTTVGGDFFRFQTPARVSVGFKQSTMSGY